VEFVAFEKLARRFALHIVETGIRFIIFAIPTSLVAQWSDVPPTWKTSVFLMFCIFWWSVVFDGKKDSARPDNPSAADHRKAPKDVMTPAQVAAAARQLSKPKTER
jgi:hypothetical protein